MSCPNRLISPRVGFSAEKQHAQERGLAGARRPGEELERVRRELEAHIAQDFRPEAVAQADIFEADHAFLRIGPGRLFTRAPLLSPGAINNSLTIFGAIVAKSRAERGFLWFPVR